MSSPAPDSQGTWTVGRIIEWTTAHLKKHGSDTPRLDAEILLAKARGCPRIRLYVDYAVPLTDVERGTMRELVRRRAAAEPVAYLVGHREFFGLDFRVNPDVLIPRPETETLVLELLTEARKRGIRSAECGVGNSEFGVRSVECGVGDTASLPTETMPAVRHSELPTPNSALRTPHSQLPTPHSLRLLDVGTGSGCIAVACAVSLPEASVTAIDISPQALAVARENARSHRVEDRVRFLEGDLFAPLESGATFDFIASNPPYVADGEMEALPDNIKKHEPHLALRAGARGLDVIERLIAAAPARLAQGGMLLVEIAPEQGDAVIELIAAQPTLEAARTIKDSAGDLRVVVARRVRK